MSVVKVAYATPSRVRGVYKLLLHTKNQQMEREELEKTVSPLSIQNEVKPSFEMAKAAITEMVKMQLFKETDGIVTFADGLPTELVDPELGDEVLPYYIASLFFNPMNEENHDFAMLASWYLTQNVLDAPGSWPDVEKALDNQIGPNKLECTNNTPYGQLEDWLIFCRLAWKLHVRGAKFRLTPDPTLYIKWVLPKIFSNQQTLTLKTLVESLASIAPVFEGGEFRTRLNEQYKIEDFGNNVLSSTTSHALLSLYDEGIIRLDRKSDAEVMILNDGGKEIRYSEITYNR